MKKADKKQTNKKQTKQTNKSTHTQNRAMFHTRSAIVFVEQFLLITKIRLWSQLKTKGNKWQ